MSNENETQSVTELDILTQDLSGVDTSLPLIVDGIYELEVKEVKQEPTKDGAKQNLNITLVTVGDASTTRRDVVHAGFPLYRTISLTPTEKYTADMVRRGLAEFAQALGVATVRPLEALVGKRLYAKVVIDPERTDKATGKRYDSRNSISRFLKPGEVSGV